MTAVRLITIPFSHYCEKARWALERCDVPYEEEKSLPLLHYVANRRAGAGRTVPVVVAGDEILGDSTDIIAWADRQKPGALLPHNDNDRAEAIAAEDEMDRQLGPATRRWAYYYLLSKKDVLYAIARAVPRWQQVAIRLGRPLATLALRRGLKIDAAGAERSRQKIDDLFARVSERLADGRRFLVGGRFSVADLTFASLAAPVLMPPEQPYAVAEPATFPAEAQAQLEAWRASPAGQYGLRLYREQRRA